MSKFNYMSSIITISCFKYLLTFFMDDIGIIGSYLWFCSLHKKIPTKFKDIIDT